MNVNDGIRAVAGIVDFESENVGYDVVVTSMFNRHQQAIFAMHAWTFAEQEADILLRPDHTTGTISATNGSYAVVGVGTEWDTDMARAWIYMPDEKWYRIGRAEGTVMFLEQKYAGETASGQIYTIRWRYYAMPRDAVDMLGIACRRSSYPAVVAPGKDLGVTASVPAYDNARPLEFISAAQEQGLPLTEERTGRPSVFMAAKPWRQRAPDQALTATASTTGGALPASTKYRYCYTWMLHGVESPPSAVVEITTGASTATNRVTLANLAEATNTLPRTLRLYRALGDQGTFFLLASGAFAGGAFVDDGDPDVDREVALQPEGTHQYLRFWPRPAEVEVVALRYHARPKPLVGLTDSFALPTEYHDMLVHLVLGDVFSKHGDVASANFYRKRAREALEAMQDRYLSHVPNVAVKQTWTSIGGFRRNVGTPRLIS